ncbi:MAG: tetratricopeptide repeat protein [Bacteroidia bacterium]
MKRSLIISILALNGVSASAQTLKEAIRLNENEQQEAAAAMYEQLIIKEPNNGNLYYYYGENWLDAENPEKAAQAFAKGLEKDPANPINLIGQAEIKLQDGDLAGGKSLVEQAIKAAGNKNLLVLMESGEALMHYPKAQDLMSAQTYLDMALKMDAKNPEIYNLQGDLYSELNNGTQAAINYNKALDMDKTQVKALLHKGQLYKRSTNYDGAIVEFENAIKIDPNFAPAYREMGEAYFKKKEIEKAKENYRKYLDLSKNNTSARLRYAYFLLETEDYKGAQTELNNITRVDSSSVGMMRIMSYVAYENNLLDTALRTIRKVFELTEKDTARRIGRDFAYYGKALAKTGNDSLGTEYLRRAIAVDPRNGELYDDLGKMATKSKKYDVAVQAYRDKIANLPKITSADYFSLGRALYSAKNYVEADTIFTKVTTLSPNWPNGYLYLGRTNSQIDSAYISLKAIPAYTKYIELVTADSANAAKYSKELIESYSYIAVVNLRKKDKDLKTSLEYWNKVLMIDPKQQQALEAIKIINQLKEGK